MAKIEKYTCDECQAEKGETNHWYRLVVIDDKELHLHMLEAGTGVSGLHLCGQKCVLAKVDKFMSGTARAGQ